MREPYEDTITQCELTEIYAKLVALMMTYDREKRLSNLQLARLMNASDEIHRVIEAVKNRGK